MKIHSHHRRWLTALQRTYIHHIAWGIVSLLMLTALLGIWSANQTLERKTRTLEQQINALSSARAVCHSRDTWQADTVRNFSVDVDGATRDFLVHLPKDFSISRYYPALLFFGGKGSSAQAALNHPGVKELPAITVFPQPTLGNDGVYAWQGAPYSSGADDVTFVNAVLDKVQGQLCIDRSRIYAAGWSNGGGMVALLSCRMSDRIAAYGMTAGALYYPTSECTPTRPTPIISIHGDNDNSVPYAGSLARRLPNIDEWSAKRASMNACSIKPFTTYPNGQTVTTTWQFCKDGATVEHQRIRGAGHAWTSTMPATMWQFMSKHSL